MADAGTTAHALFLIDRGVSSKGKNDCGDHEWFNQDDVTVRCIHCEQGEMPYSSALFNRTAD